MPQPDGVCCRTPDYLQVRGELCEPGQRPPGEAAGLPGRDDGREQRQPHELHCEPAGMCAALPILGQIGVLGAGLALGSTMALDREAALRALEIRQT